MSWNPYYDQVKDLIDEHDWNDRTTWQKEYAWSIPSDDYAEAIMKAGIRDIIEWGAGSGYWAKFMNEHGLQVRAYDNHSWAPNGQHIGTFYPVQRTEWDVGLEHHLSSISRTPYTALMLVWPPYRTSMAFDALKAWTGRYLCYVGEGWKGCTGDDEFHSMLAADWDEIEYIPQNNWWGIHSSQRIYRRIR